MSKFSNLAQDETLMVPVASTTIRRIGYDEETETLIVEFFSGTYIYDGVPAEHHAALMAAESPGAPFRGQHQERFCDDETTDAGL